MPCERLVFTSIAEDAEGNAALDEITTVTFASEGSKTKVTVHSKAVGIAPARAQHARRHGEGLVAEHG